MHTLVPPCITLLLLQPEHLLVPLLSTMFPILTRASVTVVAIVVLLLLLPLLPLLPLPPPPPPPQLLRLPCRYYQYCHCYHDSKTKKHAAAAAAAAIAATVTNLMGVQGGNAASRRISTEKAPLKLRGRSLEPWSLNFLERKPLNPKPSALN